MPLYDSDFLSSDWGTLDAAEWAVFLSAYEVIWADTVYCEIIGKQPQMLECNYDFVECIGKPASNIVYVNLDYVEVIGSLIHKTQINENYVEVIGRIPNEVGINQNYIEVIGPAYGTGLDVFYLEIIGQKMPFNPFGLILWFDPNNITKETVTTELFYPYATITTVESIDIGDTVDLMYSQAKKFSVSAQLVDSYKPIIGEGVNGYKSLEFSGGQFMEVSNINTLFQNQGNLVRDGATVFIVAIPETIDRYEFFSTANTDSAEYDPITGGGEAGIFYADDSNLTISYMPSAFLPTVYTYISGSDSYEVYTNGTMQVSGAGNFFSGNSPLLIGCAQTDSLPLFEEDLVTELLTEDHTYYLTLEDGYKTDFFTGQILEILAFDYAMFDEKIYVWTYLNSKYSYERTGVDLISYSNTDIFDIANAVNLDHPLNYKKNNWWLCLPGVMGGGIWLDLIGGNNGILTNMLSSHSTSGWGSSNRPGEWGKIGLDGVDDQIICPKLSNINNDMTVACWVKLSTSGFFNPLVSSYQYSSGNSQWYLVIDNLQPQFYTCSGPNDYGGTGAANINVKEWSHIVATYDSNLDVQKVYINGLESDSFSNSNPINPTRSGINIGALENFAWSDLGSSLFNPSSGTGQDWIGTGDSWTLDLGFDFPFFGKSYNSVYVSNNGLLTFPSSFPESTSHYWALQPPQIAVFFDNAAFSTGNTGYFTNKTTTGINYTVGSLSTTTLGIGTGSTTLITQTNLSYADKSYSPGFLSAASNTSVNPVGGYPTFTLTSSANLAYVSSTPQTISSGASSPNPIPLAVSPVNFSSFTANYTSGTGYTKNGSTYYFYAYPYKNNSGYYTYASSGSNLAFFNDSSAPATFNVSFTWTMPSNNYYDGIVIIRAIVPTPPPAIPKHFPDGLDIGLSTSPYTDNNTGWSSALAGWFDYFGNQIALQPTFKFITDSGMVYSYTSNTPKTFSTANILGYTDFALTAPLGMVREYAGYPVRATYVYDTTIFIQGIATTIGKDTIQIFIQGVSGSGTALYPWSISAGPFAQVTDINTLNFLQCNVVSYIGNELILYPEIGSPPWGGSYAAFGEISFYYIPNDGDTITLSDGVTTYTYEFFNSTHPSPPATYIDTSSGSFVTIATSLVTAIFGTGHFSTSLTVDEIFLTNTTSGTIGNVPMTASYSGMTTPFFLRGMSNLLTTTAPNWLITPLWELNSAWAIDNPQGFMGYLSFEVAEGLPYLATGDWNHQVFITSVSHPSIELAGVIISYNGTQLVVFVYDAFTSGAGGTYNDWSIPYFQYLLATYDGDPTNYWIEGRVVSYLGNTLSMITQISGTVASPDLSPWTITVYEQSYIEGSTTIGAAVIFGVSSTEGLYPGQAIFCYTVGVIPSDTFIVAIESGPGNTSTGYPVSITISKAALLTTTFSIFYIKTWPVQFLTQAPTGFLPFVQESVVRATASAAPSNWIEGIGYYYGQMMIVNTTTFSGSGSYNEWDITFGNRVQATSISSPTNWMQGEITSYSYSGTNLAVDMDTTNGSGTFSDWQITPVGNLSFPVPYPVPPYATSGTSNYVPQPATLPISVSFSFGTPIPYVVGEVVRLYWTGDPRQWMQGPITSTTYYSNSITITATLSSGYGYYNSWGIKLAPVYSDLSFSSNTIATGSVTFTVDANMPFNPTDTARATYTLDGTQWMEGSITSYSGTTLVINVTSTNGSGTYDSWSINFKARVQIINEQNISQSMEGDIVSCLNNEYNILTVDIDEAQGLGVNRIWDVDTIPVLYDIFVDKSIANQVTIRWQTVVANTNQEVNFAATLFSNGNIQFDYGDFDAGAYNSVVGLTGGLNTKSWTSSSAVAFITGTQTFVLTSSLVFFGDIVTATSTSPPGYLQGTVISYSSTTLVIDATIASSFYFSSTSWVITSCYAYMIPSLNINTTISFGPFANSFLFSGENTNTTGDIDDIGIWSRALPPQEVNSLYNSSKSQYQEVLRRLRKIACILEPIIPT